MAAISVQKDLAVAYKKGTFLDLVILNRLVPMPPELKRPVFKENALEKPTQNLFNHLSHYLVCIMDPAASATLSWPLYDTKTERAYRNELSNFISSYSSKGLLGPVMSSYFVNPGCFKVTKLLFEMSQQAVQKLLNAKMEKDSQKALYNDMTAMFKSQEKDYVELTEKELEKMKSKLTNYLQKRTAMEKIAELFRIRITQMEKKLKSLDGQKYIDDLVDGFLAKNTLDEETKAEIKKIKNIKKPAPIFDNYLLETDRQLDEIESKWSEKITPLLSISKTTEMQTKTLISRATGEADKSTYLVEYNNKTDFICTKDLQGQVNSQQRFILKNMVKDDQLNFPNLIRGFLVAMCFVLKNAEIGDEIFQFNEYLAAGAQKYGEIVLAMKALIERVMNAEASLQPSPVSLDLSMSMDIPEISPLPDLSNLLIPRELQCQAIFDSFTPLSMSKHQFNLHGRRYSFAKPQLRTIGTFSQDKDDFLKNLIAKRGAYDCPSIDTSHFHNISAVPHVNETIAECSSGFTNQQVQRILSTKQSSSSKKYKYKTDCTDNINIRKGALFNRSKVSQTSESNGLVRSHSSPNLFEPRERSASRMGRRKLSIMPEYCPSLLEVSGVAALDKDSFNSLSLNLKDTASMPAIIVTPVDKFNQMLQEFNVNGSNPSLIEITPKRKIEPAKKISSLEKIINRYKKVRASVLPTKTIVEEKDNLNVDAFTVNRVLLPDLVNPSCSKDEYLDKVCMEIDESNMRKPRASLGTALGVDQTFLDQFDLID